jgi:hypothetical protein
VEDNTQSTTCPIPRMTVMTTGTMHQIPSRTTEDDRDNTWTMRTLGTWGQHNAANTQDNEDDDRTPEKWV